jgi:hypothetical protein
MMCHIKGRTYAESLREQSTRTDIWALKRKEIIGVLKELHNNNLHACNVYPVCNIIRVIGAQKDEMGESDGTFNRR